MCMCYNTPMNNKQHLNLNTPCYGSGKRKRITMLDDTTNSGYNSVVVARVVLLSYLHLPINSREGCVLHACNNEGCINPLHLYLGTQRDNIHDQIVAGTHTPGFIDHPNKPKLWRCISPAGVTTYRLGVKRAAEYAGVSPTAVSRSYTNNKPTKTGWLFKMIR